MNKYEEALDYIWNKYEECEIVAPFMTRHCLDILKELVEKATPKKPTIIPNNFNELVFECPVCHKRTYTNFRREYCGECGQALDWSEEVEDEFI